MLMSYLDRSPRPIHTVALQEDGSVRVIARSAATTVRTFLNYPTAVQKLRTRRDSLLKSAQEEPDKRLGAAAIGGMLVGEGVRRIASPSIVRQLGGVALVTTGIGLCFEAIDYTGVRDRYMDLYTRTNDKVRAVVGASKISARQRREARQARLASR